MTAKTLKERLEQNRQAQTRNREVRSLTIDPAVWKMIEEAAAEHEMSVSAYVEGALLWDQVEEGNAAALKLAAGRLKARIREKITERFGLNLERLFGTV